MKGEGKGRCSLANEENYQMHKVIPLQARCGPDIGYRYSSTLP